MTGFRATWRSRFAEIIAEAVAELPADAPLSARVRVVDAARPKGGCMSASWPRKAWQAARRDYLIRYGYEPRTKRAAERRGAVVHDLPLFGGGK